LLRFTVQTLQQYVVLAGGREGLRHRLEDRPRGEDAAPVVDAIEANMANLEAIRNGLAEDVACAGRRMLVEKDDGRYQLLSVEYDRLVGNLTFLRWIREEKRVGKKESRPADRGRPRTAEEVRSLTVRLARENNWGCARIVGELKKLGIHSIKKSTVRNILKADGRNPCPKRSGASWDEFLTRHAASLWQCDFFTQNVLTVKGLREGFVLAFLNVKTGRVVLSPTTSHSNPTWIARQA